MTDWGQIAADRLAAIAACSEPGPGVTRLPFSECHRSANAQITGWMQAAGLTVHLDAAATLVGRLEGPKDAPTFYIGSHQDSVREGGRFDGIMGIALACLALERLKVENAALPFAVEVLAFADEEGVRFPTALIGPRALAGTFDPSVLDLADRDGITLAQALSAFGGEPDAITMLKRDPEKARGYFEVHIEQGPILERANEALGIVTAICGIERHTVTYTGETGHAGTLPMDGRRDALVGAAQFVSAANEIGRSIDGLRVTVGELHVAPNVVNAVPREVRLTAELRSPDNGQRHAGGQALAARGEALADVLDLDFSMERTYRQTAAPCDIALRADLTAAVRAQGCAALDLPSGATHDASAMADLCPIAMLFVRCQGGVSHVPEEHASAADMGAAIAAMAHFLTHLDT